MIRNSNNNLKLGKNTEIENGVKKGILKLSLIFFHIRLSTLNTALCANSPTWKISKDGLVNVNRTNQDFFFNFRILLLLLMRYWIIKRIRRLASHKDKLV